MKYKTEQESFWAEEFGNEYVSRNRGVNWIASNLSLFSSVLRRVEKIDSILEFGANIGMNMTSLKLLCPNAELSAVEINEKAIEELKNVIPEKNIFKGSIFDSNFVNQSDLSFIKGVLIHINPDMLDLVYEKIYKSSKRYVLIAEYYNPSPVAIPYRGHSDRLFKRDFAGEFMQKYPDMKMIDYGFVYKGDLMFPQDDVTWFLMERR